MNTDPEQDTQAVGRPLPRADGREKVTGGARYTAEMEVPGAVCGFLVESAIAHGTVLEIDTQEAARLPGVLAVLTREHMPRFGDAPVTLSQGGQGAQGGSAGQQYLPLQDDAIYYGKQHLAFVVAETFEQARYAATRVHVRYQDAPPRADMDAALTDAFTPHNGWPEPAESARGDAAAGLAQAGVRVDATYHTALQHHVTMEPHATVAAWDGDVLTLYEPSTWVYGVRQAVATWLGMPEDKIRVIQHFVGGSFGSKGPTWPHVALTAVAARQVGRPVRLALTRPQTFTSNGRRPKIQQRVRLGAAPDGRMTALIHDATAETAVFDNRIVAPVTKTPRKMYACPNVTTTYKMVHLNLPGPFTMRGPGETPGLFATECAMDELAHALEMDPIALRLKNYAEGDPDHNKPWSSIHLRECYRQGAARFGWDRRTLEPGSMRTSDGRRLGMGMATMAYDARTSPTAARARLSADGQVLVQSATSDPGTGARTIMTQVAADTLGVPVERVRFELGDTAMPKAPIAAGSQTSGSVGSAVRAACLALRTDLLVAAFVDPSSPLHGQTAASVDVQGGRVFVRGEPARGETYAAIAGRRPGGVFDAEGQGKPSSDAEKYTRYSFGAHFAEVAVDPDLGEVRVTRYTGAFAAGRILNPKTAHSQLIGGIIWGIGQALMEETHLDLHKARFVNSDLAEYHIPTSADVPEIEAFFVAEDDPIVNPLGVKGIGEIGTIGSAAAIANAVYHATGKRVRDLPITLDKLL